MPIPRTSRRPAVWTLRGWDRSMRPAARVPTVVGVTTTTLTSVPDSVIRMHEQLVRLAGPTRVHTVHSVHTVHPASAEADHIDTLIFGNDPDQAGVGAGAATVHVIRPMQLITHPTALVDGINNNSLRLAVRALMTRSIMEGRKSTTQGSGAVISDTEGSKAMAMSTIGMFQSAVDDIMAVNAVHRMLDGRTRLARAKSIIVPHPPSGTYSESQHFLDVAIDAALGNVFGVNPDDNSAASIAGEQIVRALRTILSEQDDLVNGADYHGQRLDERFFIYTPFTLQYLKVDTRKTQAARRNAFLAAHVLASKYATANTTSLIGAAMNVVADACGAAYTIMSSSNGRRLGAFDIDAVNDLYRAALGALWLGGPLENELFLEMADVTQDLAFDPYSLYGVYISCVIMYNNVWRTNTKVYGKDAPKIDGVETDDVVTLISNPGQAKMISVIKRIAGPLLK